MKKWVLLSVLLFGITAANAAIVEFPLAAEGLYDNNSPYWQSSFDLGVSFTEITNVYIDWSGTITAELVGIIGIPGSFPHDASFAAYLYEQDPFYYSGLAEVYAGKATYPEPEPFDVQSLFTDEGWSMFLDGRGQVEIRLREAPLLGVAYIIEYPSGQIYSATLIFEGTLVREPAIIFVDADATGSNDGSNWADAFNNLQDALGFALPGDEIRVAQGIYKPSTPVTPGPPDPPPPPPPPPMSLANSKQAEAIIVDRTATFQLKNGVAIKGGYAGFGEPDPDSRDIDAYETILSGDLASNDIDVNKPADLQDDPCRAENSYHVVTASGTNETAVLDGFTITSGNANGPIFGWPFFDYSRRYGGGMYNRAGSPTLTNCTFRDNSARYYGGGMYNGEDNSNPVVTNCTFKGNWAYYGGAVCNSWKSKPTLTNCAFIMNTANHDGGGMYNSYSSPILTNCTFTANSANKGNGGGVLVNCTGSSRPILNNCLFSSNSASKGGAISCIGQGPPPFPGMPPAPWRGPIITNCTISGNSASEGAGIYNSYILPMLNNCTLSGNSAVETGGGIHNTYHANIMVTNCTFSGNSAKYDGGGMANHSSNPTLTNCIFTGNSADSGGSMYNDWSSPTLANCTFAGNSAPNGNVFACDSYRHQWPSNLQLTNCLLWDGGDEIWNNDESTIAITYSDVESGWPGEGNIDADPCFVDLGYWDAYGEWFDGDYYLLSDSPCINAGDPNYPYDPNGTDLDGRPRVIGGRIDMGAYEYRPLIPAEARITPRTINLASKGKWIMCYIWLPEDYNVADIDPNNVFLESEIQAEPLYIDEQKQVAVAKFSREELRAILSAGEVEVAITGRLTDGNVFEATDVIRVIDKGGGKK